MGGRKHFMPSHEVDNDEAMAAAHSLDECYDDFLYSEKETIDRALTNLTGAGMGLQSAKSLIWAILNYFSENGLLVESEIIEPVPVDRLPCPDCEACVIEDCVTRRIFDETEARVESDLA